MSSTGKGRLYRMRHYTGLRGKVGLPEIRPASRTIANDTFWGGFPPTPTRIPYAWLTPPARFRSDPPRNVAQVTRTGGATARAVSAASVAAVGERPFTATLSTQVIADPAAYASWIVGNYTTPRRRMPQLRLNLLDRTPTELWRILAREIGDRISIIGAPAPILQVASDAFNRTVSSGLGNADSGQPYVISGGSASDYAVSGGYALFALPTVTTERTAAIANIGPDVDVTVFIRPTITVAGGAQFEQKVRVRHNGSTWYETNIQYQTSGVIDVYLLRGGVTVLSALGSVLPYNSSTTYGVRMQAYGSTIRQKVWDAGVTSEPATWTASVVDDTVPGTATDSLILAARRIAGNTDAGLVPTFSNLTADSPNPTGWPDGVTELVIEGITHTVSGDERYTVWNTAPLIGATAGHAGPWFRADESRTDTGADVLAF